MSEGEKLKTHFKTYCNQLWLKHIENQIFTQT